MSGVPTSFSSSSTRRFSAPALLAPRAAPSVRPSVASAARPTTAAQAAPVVYGTAADLDLFHKFLGLSCQRGTEAESAQALFACVDEETGTLDLTRLRPEFTSLAYTMLPVVWESLCLRFGIKTARLPQAEREDVMNQTFKFLGNVKMINHVIIVMPSGGRLPKFRGLPDRDWKITLQGPSAPPASLMLARTLTRRRASLPLLKPIGKQPEPATPTRAAARPSAPASIEPPTRHLSMPAPMTLPGVPGVPGVPGAPGTHLTVPPKRLSLDVPSTR